jgi:hypothetical protein
VVHVLSAQGAVGWNDFFNSSNEMLHVVPVVYKMLNYVDIQGENDDVSIEAMKHPEIAQEIIIMTICDATHTSFLITNILASFGSPSK